MSTLAEIIKALRADPGCSVAPPRGQPTIVEQLVLPDDLRAFYTFCGGATLYDAEDYGLVISAPAGLIPSNVAIIGAQQPEDRSASWYVIARSPDGRQFVSIDFNPQRAGQCYDSWDETHGLVGNSPVIALTFTELLERLIEQAGQGWFWLHPQFTPYGDAYD